MEERIRVLHVDDEPDLAEMTATYLAREDERITVETATNGADGFEQLSEAIDCVISDYDMPGMNGIEFLEAVRERYPDLPFILFTGKGSEEVASDAISAGVTDYLQNGTGTDQYAVLANRVTNAVAQVRAEHQVQAERRRFQILFDRLTQPTVEVEYESETPVVQQVNSAFEAVFGYDAAEIVGSSLDVYIVPEEKAEQASQINQRVRAGGGLNSLEVTRRTADGNREFLLQNAVYDDGSGGFAIYTDITDRKRREQRLQRERDRLERFTSVLSHDLRSPLNVVRGRIKLVRAERDSHHLGVAADAVDRIETLISDILTVAREGAAVQHTEPVSLPTLATECWTRVETSDATLVTDAEQTVSADPSRLKQLFENLINNSVEHNEREITVTVGDLADGFYIADDGDGIPADEREDVFESGYSTRDGGTGFGLNIVQEIAEAHGWDITLTASETGGVRFELTGVDTVD